MDDSLGKAIAKLLRQEEISCTDFEVISDRIYKDGREKTLLPGMATRDLDHELTQARLARELRSLTERGLADPQSGEDAERLSLGDRIGDAK